MYFNEKNHTVKQLRQAVTQKTLVSIVGLPHYSNSLNQQ